MNLASHSRPLDLDGRAPQLQCLSTCRTVWANGEIYQLAGRFGWVSCLCHDKLRGNDAPSFPAMLVEVGETQHFEVTGLARRPWSNASPIRTIFKQAFIAAGLPYFNPHSFRDTLTGLGMKRPGIIQGVEPEPWA